MAEKDDFGCGRRVPTPMSGQRREAPRSTELRSGLAGPSAAPKPVRAVRLDEASAELVSEVFAGRRPLTALVQQAGDQRTALHLWAEGVSTIYPNGSASGVCNFCRKLPATELRHYAWHAVISRNVMENALRLVVFVPLMLVLGHGLNMARFQRLDLPMDEVVFSTYHGCCKGCRKRLTARQTMSGVLRMSLAVVAVIAGAVALFFGLAAIGGIVAGNADREMVWAFATVFGGAMLVVIGMLAGMRQVTKRLGLPDAVRPIMRGGFVQDLRKASDRPLA